MKIPVQNLLLVVLLSFLFGPVTYAQAPAWQSVLATTQASGGSVQVFSTATDASGNVYLSGNMKGTASFGTIQLTSAGGNDAFVAKWSSSTNSFVWAQRAGGSGEDYARGIAMNGTNVYIVGTFFSKTATFGSLTLTNSNSNATTSDLFVAKLTDAGSSSNFIWAQQAKGTNSEYANSIAINGSNVYITGEFYAEVCSFGTNTLVCAGATTSFNVFVAKLIDTGTTATFTWAKQSVEDAGAKAIAVNGANVYLAGNFYAPTLTFGTIISTSTNNSTTSSSTGVTDDFFVTKLTDAGNTASFAWVQHAGGEGYDEATSLAVNGPNVYVAGGFTSISLPIGTASLLNADPTGSTDLFVAKFLDAGTSASFSWAQRAGGLSDDLATSIAAQANSVYVAGIFASAAAPIGATTLTNAGASTYDVFVTRLSDLGTTGSFNWAQSAGGAQNDYAFALAVNGGNIYVGGYLSSVTATFGSRIVTNTTTSTAGYLASLMTQPLATTISETHLYTIQVFPNPTNLATSAQVQIPASKTAAILVLSDALGRTVYTHPIKPLNTSEQYNLNLAGLPAGLYMVRLYNGEVLAVRRLIIN